jgi:tRNA pseudouridine55 synthase
MNGLLLVDKPEGLTSFGVVARVRRIVSEQIRIGHDNRGWCYQQIQGLSGRGACRCRLKVGHTGTLDPSATGLLVIAIGTYTKKVPLLIKQDKIYQVKMTLGVTSSTGDKEGQLNETSTTQPAKDQIITSLHKFTGEIMQTPPAYSAIKINGQRAYDLARKGKEVKMQPREIKIYSNELLSYEYPYVNFISHVGSGTYIRSLVADIGEYLQTGAYMSDLRRVQIGPYNISQALSINELNINSIDKHLIKDLN